MNVRKIILDEMKRQELSAYRLAKLTGLGERGLQTYVAGKCDLKGERLGAVLDALGLEIRPKAASVTKSKITKRKGD